ncbi:hypothetical protein WJX79_006284 [Trebouxia sp. C0005]
MSVSKKDLGEEHGEIRNLGSPILSKIQQAFLYIKTFATAKANDDFTSVRAVEGAHNSTLNIGWDKAEARLVLVVKVVNFDLVGQIKEGRLATPTWLEHLASGAEVEVNCLTVVDSLVSSEGSSPGLKAIIDDMTGHVAPRRIVCVGFCVGGTVATLSATWAAIQWPTADVRCISFGASAVGNAAFAGAFKWLVGISYRVTFRRDPIPAQSTAQASVLKHVHGAVYICGDSMRPGCQPKADLAKADLGDHSAQAYMGALSSNCKRQSIERQRQVGSAKPNLGHTAVEAAARAASSAAQGMLVSQVSLRESVSSASGSLDDDLDISQEPTGLASFMRAGMGNIVTDTASASKAAFASALRKLGSKSRRSSSSSSGDDTAFSDRPSVSANSDSNLDRAIYGPAKYDADLAAGKIVRSNALMAEDALPTQAQHEQCVAGFIGNMPESGAQGVDGKLPEDAVNCAYMEAAAQGSDVGSLQKIEEGSLGSGGLSAKSDEQGEAASQQEARKLTRNFSLEERDSSGVDQKDLSNLQKILVLGKISQAAILAAAAYRNHDTFKCQTGITKSRLIYDKEHHDTKVHVGWLEGGTAVFAFRGTASRQDGLQDVKIFSRNIDYLQELYPGVKAHLGFMQQFAAVCHPDRSETNMAAVLKELSGGQIPNRVICTGHSLGGALATLGAAWAALEYPDADIRCITFGSPRVANKVFGKAFNALVGTSLRLVHGFDPVPSLPPSLMYKHVPGVIHIKRDDLLLKHRPWHTMLRSTVSDHGMMKYSKGVYRHMPGGLESLPSFFAPKPVKKMCENVCSVTGWGRASSQPSADGVAASPDSPVTSPVTKSEKRKSKDEPDHQLKKTLMDLGEDHGHLQDLSSPILSKIQEGFFYMRSCLVDDANDMFTRFGSLQGPNKSTMFVAWDEVKSRLVLSCRIMDFTFLTGMREAKLASPPWLAHLASDAQVEVNCLRVFQAFVDPQDGETDLKSLIKHTIGDVNPRRVVCVGFCAAGSVTTLTAAWAAVQWPAADVRCISFGAPAVGNTAFAASFKWLVGISYRVMFRRDPVPTALAATGLKHVHGAVYLCGKSMKLGSQSKGQIAPIADLGDHAFTGYSGALYATCKVQSDRERATEGACRAKLDTHSSFSGSSLRSSSLRSEGSLGRDSTVSLTETIDSLDNGDDEEAGITSKQPTGLMAYVRSGASNLFVDTLTVSKLAVASAFTKFGKLIPRSKPKGPSGDNTAACGHEGLAAEQSARLANGDGLLAEDDAYLISGEPPSIGKAAYSPGDSTAGEVPGPLAPGVSLPERVIDDSIPGDFQDVQGAGASLGPADIPAEEGHLCVRSRVKAAHPKLARAFSLMERDSWQVDQSHLSNMQRVLVMGKISQAAIVAGAAYRNEDTFKLQTGIPKTRLIKDKVHHDTKVHVGWLEGGTAVFAFRGTASRQDGLQDVKIFSRNIDYLQELYPGVKAHMGFMQQFAAVCNPEKPETNMAAVLKELSGGQIPNRVICTGHSLGGALATLGAAWAALEYPDADIRCITFGSPRVANKVFGKAFNALVGTSLRLVHGFDPVPSLPPSLMYKHVPGVIHIRRDDLLLKHRPWHTMLRSSVTDHGMRKYSMGIYKHMPGGLEAHVAFFAVRPVARLCDKVTQAAQRATGMGGQEEQDEAQGNTKEYAEDVISPTSKAKAAGSKKGRHIRSHSSSLDWMAGLKSGRTCHPFVVAV